jgi:type II secretory pathway pseudopilin PulG
MAVHPLTSAADISDETMQKRMGKPRFSRALRRDEGFTIIETMVALGVILASVVALAYVTTSGFSSISYARQRQAASGLANQTMEQVRGLPFDTLKKGLSNTDLNALTDSSITKVGAEYFYAGEQIPRGDNANVVPIVPHTQPLRDATATVFNVSTYVTYYQNKPTTNTFRVTVVVRWTANGGARAAQVQTASIFYSGSGCLSTQTHPFAAPCQPYFFSSAANSSGLMAISGTMDGATLDQAKLFLPEQDSNLEIEQTSLVQGTDVTGGASVTLLGQAEQVIGAKAVTSGADNDPGQPGLDYQNTAQATQSVSTLHVTGSTGLDLAVTSSTNDTGSTTSTTSASLSPSHPCNDLTGVSQTDKQPCGNTTGKLGSAETATLDVLPNGKRIGTATLISLGVPATSSIAYSDRAPLPEGTLCPSATLDGCSRAALSRSWGRVTLGGLPDSLDPGVAPPGWAGYLVSLDNAAGTASAEVGIGSLAPAASVSGTVSVWNGVGYTIVALLPGAKVPLVIAPVHVQQFINAKLLTIDISASLSTGGTTLNDPAACIVPCTRTTASATVNSPLTGTITYVVVYDGVTLASLTTSADLGYVQAKGTYQASPSG